GLGRAARRRGSRGADPVPDHLPVDAAALLGARAVPRGGLPQVRPAHAARDARQRVHAAADPAVHHRAVRGLPDAVRVRHEFVDLPGRGAGAQRGLHVVRFPPVARVLRRARPQDLPLLPDPSQRAVRGAAAGPLPAVLTMQRRTVLLTLAGTAATLIAGCAENKPQFKAVDITGADY